MASMTKQKKFFMTFMPDLKKRPEDISDDRKVVKSQVDK